MKRSKKYKMKISKNPEKPLSPKQKTFISNMIKKKLNIKEACYEKWETEESKTVYIIQYEPSGLIH
ncbi:MAG: hypothetical protein A3J42_08610 [Candidatus Dadabacteria bacterium RIFCSPHIGHO2_12_FULL_53_21]|nr:MAG: hypothetical protein A3J42_08610 [Candidatus Dadabacteria bacterium RIFCSPHIGHO2_12_FULL_53_21]